MNVQSHGLSVSVERSANDFYVSMRLQGVLTHEDYEALIPLIEHCIAGIDEPHIRALVDLREMEGWEWRAAWDDICFGMRRGSVFTHVAVVGHSRWLAFGTRLGSWLTPATCKYFEDVDEAVAWLQE